MVRIFFIALLVIGFIEALKTIPIGLGIIPPESPPAAISTASVQTSLASNVFAENGTLIFYPNNVGPVPYLYYTDGAGNLATKGLIFLQNEPRNLESWAGSRIHVEGQVDHSSLIVSKIARLSGP